MCAFYLNLYSLTADPVLIHTWIYWLGKRHGGSHEPLHSELWVREVFLQLLLSVLSYGWWVGNSQVKKEEEMQECSVGWYSIHTNGCGWSVFVCLGWSNKSMMLEPNYARLCFFFIFLLFLCAYNAWVNSPPCPHPLPYHPVHPLPLSPTPSRNYFALISNFVEERV
jgi:hypothetical protein